MSIKQQHTHKSGRIRNSQPDSRVLSGSYFLIENLENFYLKWSLRIHMEGEKEIVLGNTDISKHCLRCQILKAKIKCKYIWNPIVNC